MIKEDDYSEYFIKIEKLTIKELQKSIKVKRDMAYKYRRGENIPPLEKAITLEKDFAIPVKTWFYFSNYKKEESKC